MHVHVHVHVHVHAKLHVHVHARVWVCDLFASIIKCFEMKRDFFCVLKARFTH